MRSLFYLVALLLFTAVSGLAQTPRDIGAVDIATSARVIPVTVTSADAEMNRLANFAFEAHGAFRRVTSGGHFTVRLTPAGGSQVRVEVLRGNESRLNQTVAGTSARHALLRAADAAVAVMGGGRGFFASRLAFISERTGMPEVYVGDLFFGGVQQLTADHKQAMTPRWSPDGTRLLYTGYYRTGFPDIFQIDLTTMQRTPFVNFNGTNSGARFSPDGQRVAMVLSGEGNPEIYVSNAQGRQVARLTRTSGVEASPVFSPDGARLVFTSDMAGGPQLYLMPSRGGQATRLPTNISRYCAEPDWSTGDPNKIAFTMRIGRGFQIGVYDLAHRQPAKQVSRAPMDAVEPSWLADGRHLVYTARSANARSIWLLDTETGQATRLSGPELGMVSQASVLHPR